MKSPASWSVRALLLTFVAVVILTSLGLIIYGEMQHRTDILEAIEGRMHHVAESAGLREEAVVGNARQTLAALAPLPALGRLDRDRYRALFRKILQQDATLEDIAFADTQGRILIAGRSDGHAPIADRAWFHRAMAEGRPSVGGYTRIPGTRQDTLPVIWPLQDEAGRPTGSLIAFIALEALKAPLQAHTNLERATLEILDAEGRLLCSATEPSRSPGRPEPPEYMARLLQMGREARLREHRDGETFIHILRRLDLNPGARDGAWLRVAVPEAPLLGSARVRLYQNLGILGSLTLALIALAWWLGAALIAAPIERFTRVAQRMSEGGFTVKTGLAEGSNEVSRLARAFERLGHRLDIRERQLRKAKAKSDAIAHRFRNLEQHSPDGVFWIRPHPEDGFRYEEVNPAFERLLGTTQEGLLGKSPRELLLPEAVEPLLAQYRDCMATGSPGTTHLILDGAGSPRSIEVLLIPLGSGPGSIEQLVGFCRDITEARATEEAIRQSQKLKSLGILAGGIAHDFNNLLTAILGNLDLAQVKLGSGNPAAHFLETIDRTVKRASDLTRQLLAYSGKGHFVVRPLDLSAVVQEMTHLLGVTISRKIRLDYRFAEHLPPIEADATQIQQVIMNLVTNASEAIGDREGFISISTRCSEMNNSFISATFPDQAIAPGLFVILEVSDNGCGMSRRVLDHIFDPFFTTKSSGKGLGLSAMLGILRGHRAGIKIYSEVGQGSAFKLFFPAARDAVIPSDYVSPPTPISAEGTVLVVDDDADIREAASIALETLGFTVLTAADGQEAVEVYRTYQEEIRAVLMDLTMPRMDGREAFGRIRAIDPAACIILSSGYSEQDIRHTFTGELPAGFIQKPYHLKELQSVLMSCLQPLWEQATPSGTRST